MPTTLLEVLVLVTLALYGLTLVLYRRPLPKRTFLDVPIALFLIAGIIGTFVAPDHRGALGIFRAYLVEPIGMFYVAVAVLDSNDEVERLLATWALGSATFAAIEIAVFVRVLASGKVAPSAMTAALFINPNSVALYIEPLIALAAGFAMFARGHRRWLAIAMLVILLPAEVATLSRGGLLAMGIMLVIAVLTLPSVRLRIAIAVAAVAGGALIRLLPVVGPRAANGINPESATLFERVSIWIVTLRMLRDRPIFGAGINAYEKTVAPYRAADPQLSPEPYPHNIVLTSWTELGLLGLAAFVYILVNLMVRPWRAFSSAGDVNRPLLWGVGAAFAALAVHGLVDSPYWKNDLSVEFWLLAALEVVVIAAVRSRAEAR